METKICAKCKVPKSLDQFNRKTGTRLQSYCKDCTKAAVRKHYDENPEYYVDKASRRKQAMRVSIASEKRTLRRLQAELSTLRDGFRPSSRQEISDREHCGYKQRASLDG